MKPRTTGRTIFDSPDAEDVRWYYQSAHAAMGLHAISSEAGTTASPDPEKLDHKNMDASKRACTIGARLDRLDHASRETLACEYAGPRAPETPQMAEFMRLLGNAPRLVWQSLASLYEREKVKQKGRKRTIEFWAERYVKEHVGTIRKMAAESEKRLAAAIVAYAEMRRRDRKNEASSDIDEIDEVFRWQA